MKLCINCEFCQTSDNGEDFYKCNAPQNLTNTISAKTRRWEFCDTLRDNGTLEAWLFKMCGKNGRWFKQK